MHRPKKEFMPTTLSDLNIDTISLGSNSDRHNNNANGARHSTSSNLSRSKATSSFHLASRQEPSQSRSNNQNNFSRTSKLYGSQSNISSASSSVNNHHINSPSSTPLDKWERAWEDNNNFYRPETMTTQQQQQFQHSFPKHVSQSKSFNSFNSTSTSTSNRSQNVYVDDPFDDPWSGTLNSLLSHTNIFLTQSNVSKQILYNITFHIHTPHF